MLALFYSTEIFSVDNVSVLRGDASLLCHIIPQVGYWGGYPVTP